MKPTIYLIIIAMAMIACSREEELTPSMKDVDRVATQIDLSKPLVKFLYETYNCGILYEFDFTLDFAYLASSRNIVYNWQMVNLEKLDSSDVDFALGFLEDNVFQYFKDGIESEGSLYQSDYFLNQLPFKVLVCREVNTTNGFLFDPLTLSDSRATDNGTGVLHSIGNDHTFVFGVDRRTILASSKNFHKYRNDNFFLFMVYVMEKHHMYDLILSQFFETSIQYFGENIGDMYKNEGYIVDEYGLVDKEWFLNRGFVDARYFYGREGLPDVTIGDLTIEKAIKGIFYFPSSNEDFVNSYLNELIHTNSSKLDTYPGIIKEKFIILIEQFMEWGVDIVAFNPELNSLYNE
ncbi:MAG: hypothetical protein ABFS10_00875 [Bacteroidota bacterium]